MDNERTKLDSIKLLEVRIGITVCEFIDGMWEELLEGSDNRKFQFTSSYIFYSVDEGCVISCHQDISEIAQLLS